MRSRENVAIWPRRAFAIRRVVLVAVLLGGGAVAWSDAPFAPARVDVTLDVIAEDLPAIGVNEFGDSGGISFAAGNVIPGAGFEPINMRRSWRVLSVDEANGYPWITLDGGGMTDWDLTTTGYLNGASYRLYRIVDRDGRPLPVREGYLDLRRADRFVRVGEGVVPEAGAPRLPLGGWVDEPGERRVYLDGARPQVWDYIIFEKRTVDPDAAWSHPRLDDSGQSDAVAEMWRPGWGLEEADLELARRPHGAPPPPEMPFPGETAYRVTAGFRGPAAIHGPYIFFPINDNPEGNWYGTLEPGARYRYEAWMRQEGLGARGRVELGFFSTYDDIATTVTVDGTWRLHSFTFTAPERPTHDGWHGGPAIRFTGPGTLEIDNVRLFRADTPADERALFVPSPRMVDELMASQPAHGEKGILRSMYVALNNATMASLLTPYADADVVYDWYVAVQARAPMTIAAMLDYAYRTGSTASERMKPWLNISSRAPEEEWLILMEYLAAPIDPSDPRDVAAKPWAYLRYEQRGTATPWTEEFPEIIVEFANETWHNGAVESQWDGWGRDNWVHTGGLEFGLWARFIGDHLRDHSPWYAAARDAGRITLVMGSNYDDYAEQGLPLAPEVNAVGHATYVGPRWEQGEEPNAVFDDAGLQATLLGYVGGLDEEFAHYAETRDALAAEGVSYRLFAYEGGPSGYSLPGSAPEEQVAVAERYGKSQAMAVATLDAWLGAYRYGFTEMAYHAFAQGSYWSSHTPVRLGFRPHAAWLALTLRNRFLTGDMVTATVVSTPTLDWNGEEEPLIGAYAFADADQIAVAIVSRRLGGPATPVTLRLPLAPRGPALLYALDGDPAASNLESFAVSIRGETRTLAQEATVLVPPGSVHIYVIPRR